MRRSAASRSTATWVAPSPLAWRTIPAVVCGTKNDRRLARLVFQRSADLRGDVEELGLALGPESSLRIAKGSVRTDRAQVLCSRGAEHAGECCEPDEVPARRIAASAALVQHPLRHA